MFMLLKAIGIGLLVAVVCTVIITVGGGILAGGFGATDFVWIFFVSVVPILSACIALAKYAEKLKGSNRSGVIIALVIAFLTVTIAGSVTAPIVQSLQFGVHRVNVSGYVVWGPVYGVFLLPLSAPIAFMVLRLFVTGAPKKSFPQSQAR
jgi:hypothetical protein